MELTFFSGKWNVLVERFLSIDIETIAPRVLRLLLISAAVGGLSYVVLGKVKEVSATHSYLSEPEVGDIYFIDYTQVESQLRPNEKFRFAKVVDSTGGQFSLRYSSYFVSRRHALDKSYISGLFTTKAFFDAHRVEFNREQLASMYDSGVILRVRRPDLSFLNRFKIRLSSIKPKSYTYVKGKQENAKGMAWLEETYQKGYMDKAFGFLSQSAEANFALGQLNLAELYLNPQFEHYSPPQAMHWFEQAALQGLSTGAKKYEIVCATQPRCDVEAFYQRLDDADINYDRRY